MSIIAVSRGTYSGGQALAECVAEKLGYRILSRDDLIEAASGYGIPADEVAAAMDRPPSLWERFTGARRAIYLYSIQAALCERAREGKLVYHGHMGHLLLPGVSHVIGVRVIADMEYRIATAMEQRTVTRDQAAADIKRIDRERAAWTQFLHGVQWDDPSMYDVVIKLGRIGPDSACEMIAGTAQLREFQPTPESLKAMEDLTLSSLVKVRLATNPRTQLTDVRVSADAGVVTVTGVVDWQEAVKAIPEVAQEVEGVKEVKNEARSTRVIRETA